MKKIPIFDAEARLRTSLNNKIYRKVNRDHPAGIYGFQRRKFGRNAYGMSIIIDNYSNGIILHSMVD